MKSCARKDATNRTTEALRLASSGFRLGHASSIFRLACLTALLTGCGIPHASPRAVSTETVETATVGADGRSLVVWGHSCRLTAPADRARISSDGKAFIVNDRGYVESAQLKACGDNPVTVRQIPREAGRLEDVNLASGRYIALLPVSTSPMLYVALVARIGSLASLVVQPGAWQSRLPIGSLQQQGFGYDEVAGPFARFSADGRYVVPNGEPDCSPDAYPGVWDLQSGKKTQTADPVGCQALFATGAPKVDR